jgi:hypothetical protein
MKIKLLGKGQFCSVHSVAASLPRLKQDEYGGDKEQGRKRMIYAYKAVDMHRIAGDDDLVIAASIWRARRRYCQNSTTRTSSSFGDYAAILSLDPSRARERVKVL